MRGETSVGLWWEPVVVDAQRMETITFKAFRRGFSGCPAMGLNSTDHTGYWGAARDRIPGAGDDLFEATVGTSERCPITGATYRKVQPPKNMCVIRSGVSWEKCDGEQLKDWRERIKPKLDAGMTYLRENPGRPAASRCARLNPFQPTAKNSRKPIRSAPSSRCSIWKPGARIIRAIWRSIPAPWRPGRNFRRSFSSTPTTRSSSSKPDNPPFEYFNCHPQTGLLPFADKLGHKL